MMAKNAGRGRRFGWLRLRLPPPEPQCECWPGAEVDGIEVSMPGPGCPVHDTDATEKGQPVASPTRPTVTVTVTVDERHVQTFVQWCMDTGHHHGADWEPLVEQLNAAPTDGAAPASTSCRGHDCGRDDCPSCSARQAYYERLPDSACSNCEQPHPSDLPECPWPPAPTADEET